MDNKSLFIWNVRLNYWVKLFLLLSYCYENGIDLNITQVIRGFVNVHYVVQQVEQWLFTLHFALQYFNHHCRVVLLLKIDGV